MYKHQAILKGTHFTDEETDGQRGCNLNNITQVVSFCSKILWFSDWATPKKTPTSFYSRKYKPSPHHSPPFGNGSPQISTPHPHLKGHVRSLRSLWGNGAFHLMTVFGFASKRRVKSPVRGSVLGPMLTGIFPLVWGVPLHGEAWARGSSVIPILFSHSSRTSRSIKELEFRSHSWEIQYMIARQGLLPRRLLPTPSCLSPPLSCPRSPSIPLTCLSDSHSVRGNSADPTI